VFWGDTRQPVERGSECRATHTYTLATALTPLPRWRGLPRESPLQCLRVRTHTYGHTGVYYTYHGTLASTVYQWYSSTMVWPYSIASTSTYTCTMVWHTIMPYMCPLPWYLKSVTTQYCNSTMVPGTTMVPWYHWYHGTRVPWYGSTYHMVRTVRT
jgi:hypothetical protein